MWQPIETLIDQKRVVDIWCRCYDNSARQWKYRRSADSKLQHFNGDEWEPLYWMEIPDPPLANTGDK